MGNLIIHQVKYYGAKYYFESPELGNGINIIVGDNGSGKSTFSYLIEYGLGGSIKYFKDDTKSEKYKEIASDKDNYVELDISINSKRFGLKRFINQNCIYISEGDKVTRWELDRRVSDEIFSDWLLEKLNIEVFELNLGSTSWLFNFNDIFRLLNYDQDTEPDKIFKKASVFNFVTESKIIKRSTFEALVGMSSYEYFKKINELKEKKATRDVAKSLLTNFNEKHTSLDGDKKLIIKQINELKLSLERLFSSREKYQKKTIIYDDRYKQIEEIKAALIRHELEFSDYEIRRKNIEIESGKVKEIYKGLELEIEQINKIIFTNKRLDLFSLENCPFCMSEISKEKGRCICGSTLNNDDYEKFVYSSSEYTDILKHKEKSLETVEIAIDSYRKKITSYNDKINELKSQIDTSKKQIELVISSIEYSDSSQLIDEINDKILKNKEKVMQLEHLKELHEEKDDLQSNFNNAKESFTSFNKDFKTYKNKFLSNNKKTIEAFNKIYNVLMLKSSCECKVAKIDEDYMPVLDNNEYKEKSAKVPKRLMYYFTIFTMGLKYKNVKHPRFLLIDTPETSGIDEDNLKKNLHLLDKAIELSKNEGENLDKKYQVILTTGNDKYPNEYEKFIKMRLSKKDGNFIFKKREN